MSQRKYDRREGRKSARFIDRTGMIAGRLVFMEWLGKHRGQHWWRALCDCGKYAEVMWRPRDTKSCGCLQDEVNRQRSFETQRTDGRWGLKTELRLFLPDGTETTAAELARRVGVHKRVMLKRVKAWPPERWLEPPKATGMRKAVIVKTSWHRKAQPWAKASYQKINAEGRNRRKTPSA